VKIAVTIGSFPQGRRAAIWSGIGRAAGYANGISEEKLRRLKALALIYDTYLAQGAFLAAHTRHRADNPIKNDLATPILTGRTDLACHRFAMEMRSQLEGKRKVGDKHSFQVFLEAVRNWIESDAMRLSPTPNHKQVPNIQKI